MASIPTIEEVASAPSAIPRISIQFCVQCKWNLRAAYFAQELLSTFSDQIGEVALIPKTGGIFQVHLTYILSTSTDTVYTSGMRTVLLWDRKAAGGFPETKVLKQLVRDFIAPSRDLGHSDVAGKNQKAVADTETANVNPLTASVAITGTRNMSDRRDQNHGKELGAVAGVAAKEPGLLVEQENYDQGHSAAKGEAAKGKDKDDCEDCQ